MSSEDRYRFRKMHWAHSGKRLAQTRHHAWWVLHNVISHPLLGVLPTSSAIWFHDWTSKHLNGRKLLRESPKPLINNRGAWVWHNVMGHLAIGLVPCELSFKFHDRSAEAMYESEWV